MAGVTANVGDVVAGRYRLVELVGQGGMGRVWRGHDEALERAVAVKEILVPQGTSAVEQRVRVERVRREAKIAANLRHPGIVGVYDIVEREGAPMIVMEYVAGRSLRAVLDERGPLEVAETAEIGAAVLDALAHAHAAGVVHRDVKPDNILLAEGRIALMDFGIARLTEGSTTLTESGAMVGTPRYMSPEQLESKEVTGASDLWSLGATLYTAVEGRPPFTGETLTNLYVAILLQPLQPPQRAGELAPLLTALLTKAPAGRPDAAWVAGFLDQVLARQRRNAAGDGSTRYLTDQQPPGAPLLPPSVRPAHSRRALLAAGLGVVVAAGVGIPLAVEHGGSHESGKGASAGNGTPSGSGGAHSAAGGKVTLTPRATLAGDSARGIYGIAFSPDGSTLSAAQGAGGVSVWDVRTHQHRVTLPTSRRATAPGTESVYAVAYRPDGKTLISGNGDGTVEVWDMRTYGAVSSLDAHTNDGAWIRFLSVLALSPDGKLLATSYNDTVVSLWDLTSNARVAQLKGGGEWWAQAMAFSPDGKLLAVGCGDTLSDATSDRGHLDLWDVFLRSEISTLSTTNCNLNSVAFSPDSRTLAAATGEGNVQLWGAATREAGYRLTNPRSTASSLAYSRDGTMLASGNSDGTVSLWSTATRKILATADTGAVLNTTPHGTPATCVTLSPDGKTLATGGARLMLWTLAT